MDKWIPPTEAEMAEMRSADAFIAAARERMEAEVREAPRLGLHANVTSDSETNFFTGFTENLSEGGVFIATFSPPPMGEIVALRLTVRGESEIVLQGEVRWIRTDADGTPMGCGVRFCAMDERTRLALTMMLQAAEREPLLFES